MKNDIPPSTQPPMTLTKLKFFRWLHAELGGYFWLPCPICHENFGGFEHAKVSLLYAPGCGKLICQKPSCSVEARHRNVESGLEGLSYGVPRPVQKPEPIAGYDKNDRPIFAERRADLCGVRMLGGVAPPGFSGGWCCLLRRGHDGGCYFSDPSWGKYTDDPTPP